MLILTLGRGNRNFADALIALYDDPVADDDITNIGPFYRAQWEAMQKFGRVPFRTPRTADGTLILDLNTQEDTFDEGKWEQYLGREITGERARHHAHEAITHWIIWTALLGTFFWAYGEHFLPCGSC